MSDEKPIDAAIRPVLPSRKGAVPQFDIAAQVEQLGADSLLPGYPKMPSNVVRCEPKKVPAKPDKNRSAIAREAWKKRRDNQKKKPAAHVEALAAAIATMMRLKPGERELVIEIVRWEIGK
jgi:hypothetical protein